MTITRPIDWNVAATLYTALGIDLHTVLTDREGRRIPLLPEGKVIPVVEKTYPVSETAEAVRYLQQGHVRGKIVINLD